MYLRKGLWGYYEVNDDPNNSSDGTRKTLEESQQNNMNPQMYIPDFGQTCMGIAGATTSALIMNETARNFITASYAWVSDISQSPYTYSHTENLCRTIACVSAYTGCTTVLYRSGGYKHLDTWLIGGICGVFIMALGFGRDFEEILLKILPWTVLVSLICSAACSYCTSCPEADSEKAWTAEQN